MGATLNLQHRVTMRIKGVGIYGMPEECLTHRKHCMNLRSLAESNKNASSTADWAVRRLDT